MRARLHTWGTAMVAMALSLCSATFAHASDLVLINGKIYTATGRWADAIAIAGNRIERVGTNDQVRTTMTAQTKVVDLHGRMVVPGFVDDHTHIWFGSLALDGFNFSTETEEITPEKNRAEFIARIKAFAAAHPHAAMLFGRADFGRGTSARWDTPSPDQAILDEASPDRPLIVHNTSEHALWVNSKALALAGIGDRPLPDPVEEKFVVRDAKGHPTGVLNEAAQDVIERALPGISIDEKVRILRNGVRYMNSFGITSIAQLTGGLDDLKAFDALRAHGGLTLRVRQAFAAVAVNHRLTPEFLQNLETARSTWHDDWISANLVKFFMDGDQTPPLYTAENYTAIITELDKRGYSITSHALSPAGAEMALDGYEAVERTNGPRDRRLRMEHADSLRAVDLPRFAQLGVVVSTQPEFCCGGADSEAKELPGNPWQSLLKSGAKLVFSSDWPCSWPPSPLEGIQQAVERRKYNEANPSGSRAGLPNDGHLEEAVTPEQALLAYTRTAAWANKVDTKVGTLEVGKLADLVVLSRNILAIPVDQIGATKVEATMVDGKVVYGAL